MLKFPTINNGLTEILNTRALEFKDYYITHLIITQTSSIEALNSTISLTQIGNNNENLKINNDYQKEIIETIPFNIYQNEGVKIPISICKIDLVKYKHEDCILFKYVPNYIEYNNKYLFSKTKQAIRSSDEFLIVEGTTLGRGGPVEEIPWYLRKTL